MKITLIRHLFPEKAPFSLIREEGLSDEYVFVHFVTPVKISLSETLTSLPPSSCIIYDINTPQIWHADVPLIHDWIHITGDVAYWMSHFNLNFDQPYLLQDSFFITGIVKELEHEFFSRETFSDDICNLKLKELFAKISRGKSIRFTHDKTREIFEEVRFHIFTNLHIEWDVKSMAKLANFSEARFFVLYKEIFGITPTQDLIHARIESAKHLLMKKEYLVREVASMLGYSNEQHFIRQFKERVGISPGKFVL